MVSLNETNGKGILYTYSLVHLQPKDRVMFFYASKGRGKNEGLFTKLRIRQIGNCVLIVPEKSQKDLEDFLSKWRCPFTKRGSLVEVA